MGEKAHNPSTTPPLSKKKLQTQNHRSAVRLEHFRGVCSYMRFSPQFLHTAAPSKCYWIYTKRKYITRQESLFLHSDY